ncbi:hypothetical protein COY25_02840 [Candidatus Uhrbacteria bacterium CG_4_10_14_0_2_um_filter_41_7]|uniref:Uncharacterized protein n=1 Tax=Candidatus Uhrbacteria bacterium CG_4_9_14_3_um_filter_41_35 TaxID=1975034 RepID=A0A2M7XGI7_9BACT|nr:MAG: hypothetical protein COV92_02320 [Candidatus Uhrbacteria bacterium CG11_big_fil_rev_8_21_14_0_20_41_9]PIZ53920.1 MAG: hypothetical protein COY25_02840 [Candidatus Uhrbacteria bacterium CG_4_10_14_0_2_um_filter_41_7]PJA46846.1 MAG: hypothetical protein CO173_01325 [Candidatus Uhrbacteria bacterium CG_4_9_14_3_um_filter_41_35]
MNEKNLKRLIRLAERTGDRLIVAGEGDEEPMVIMGLDDYELMFDLISGESNNTCSKGESCCGRNDQENCCMVSEEDFQDEMYMNNNNFDEFEPEIQINENPHSLVTEQPQTEKRTDNEHTNELEQRMKAKREMVAEEHFEDEDLELPEAIFAPLIQEKVYEPEKDVVLEELKNKKSSEILPAEFDNEEQFYLEPIE